MAGKSYDPSLQSEMKKAQETKCAIALSNRQVKSNRDTDEPEIVISKWSKMSMTPWKPHGVVEARVTKKLMLKLIDMTVNQQINVTAKVVSVDEAVSIMKKDGTNVKNKMGDSSATCRSVLWEGDVDTLKEENSYRIAGAGVRSYAETKYLSFGPRCSVQAVEGTE